MCNEKNQNSNQTSNIKSANASNILNKQNKITSIANMCTNETHSVDFQIHTNIKLNYSKKIQILFFVSSVVSFVCIFGSFYATYKLNVELIEIQSHITILNKKLVSLSEKCESISNTDNTMVNSFIQKENNTVEDLTSTKKIKTLESYETDYNMTEENISKANSRLRRANQRNKLRKRVVKSSGSLAAHFKGISPIVVIEDQGLIGPWFVDNTVARQYKFPKFHLTEGKCSIEVTEPALYFIYAQVYYISSNAVNSYSLYVRSEGSSQNNVIAKCSTSGPNNSHVSEISCYTAAVYNLKANDRIFMKQTEKNRTIILKDGHSFFGIVRLNNSKRGQA